MFQNRYENLKFRNEEPIHLKNLREQILEAKAVQKKIKGQYDLGRTLLQNAIWISFDR